jgi:hypothetical protein
MAEKPSKVFQEEKRKVRDKKWKKREPSEERQKKCLKKGLGGEHGHEMGDRVVGGKWSEEMLGGEKQKVFFRPPVLLLSVFQTKMLRRWSTGFAKRVAAVVADFDLKNNKNKTFLSFLLFAF